MSETHLFQKLIHDLLVEPHPSLILSIFCFFGVYLLFRYEKKKRDKKLHQRIKSIDQEVKEMNYQILKLNDKTDNLR